MGEVVGLLNSVVRFLSWFMDGIMSCLLSNSSNDCVSPKSVRNGQSRQFCVFS